MLHHVGPPVHTDTHTHTLSAYPLADLCKVSPTEALGHLGNVRKINVCGNRGLTEVGLENGEAGLQGRLREKSLASQHSKTSCDHCERGKRREITSTKW